MSKAKKSVLHPERGLAPVAPPLAPLSAENLLEIIEHHADDLRKAWTELGVWVTGEEEHGIGELAPASGLVPRLDRVRQELERAAMTAADVRLALISVA